jgi:hypothetical protein
LVQFKKIYYQLQLFQTRQKISAIFYFILGNILKTGDVLQQGQQIVSVNQAYRCDMQVLIDDSTNLFL